MSFYLVTSLLWSVLGLMGGFVLGAVWQSRREPRVRDGERQPSTALAAVNRAAGPLVLALALAMGVQYVYFVDKQRDVVDCQTEVNAAFAEIIRIRSSLSSRSQENVDRIILSISKLVTGPAPKGTKEAKAAAEKYLKLFADYSAEADLIEKERGANPLPALPANVCG